MFERMFWSAATGRRKAVQSHLTALLCLCLLLSSTVLGHAAVAQQASPPAATAGYTVGDCSNIDREALRGEIENASLAVLTDKGAATDIDALVARKWAELNVDAVLESEVSRAVSELANEENYWNRFLSGWSTGKAEEFAARISQSAFASPLFSAKMEELGSAIGAEIARGIDAEFARAASAAFLCLQEYVGQRYSQSLFDAFQNGVSKQVEATPITVDPAQTDISVLEVHAAGLTGVGVIVVTEIGRRVAQKIGQKIASRIAGKIAGRMAGRVGSGLIPVAGWVIGIGLIIWDLVEGGKGALPQIEEALKGDEVKDRIRGEVAGAVRDGMPEESAIASLEIAVTLLEEWDRFCDRYGDICALSRENAGFRGLLDELPVTELDRLSQLVTLFTAEIGRTQLDAAIANGQLDELLALPDAGRQILADSDEPATTLAWAALAGDQLDEVAASGLHRQHQPQEFTADTLATLLAAGDANATARLVALDTSELAALLALPAATLKQLVATLSADDLRWFAGYLNQAASAPTVTPPAEVAVAVAEGAVTIGRLQGTPQPTAAADTVQATPTGALPNPSEPRADRTWIGGTVLLALLIAALLGLVVGLRLRKRWPTQL